MQSIQDAKQEKKRREFLERLQAKREEDQKFVQEKVERQKKFREERFERLYKSLSEVDGLKCEIAETLRDKDQEKARKSRQLYEAWDRDVYGKIQTQIERHMNPPNRSIMHSLGHKSVSFRLPHERFRADVKSSDDPMKQSLYSTQEEEAFKRTAEIICGMGQLEGVPKACHSRSRPVLEPEMWAQLQLQATPYGHFAQGSEEVEPRTLVRTKGFVPSEGDGVVVAGKRKSNMAGGKVNMLGVLQGEFATRGETIQYKTHLGSSSGAPGQDHYTYDTGTVVVDAEFPKGKRMWKTPPGALPREILLAAD